MDYAIVPDGTVENYFLFSLDFVPSQPHDVNLSCHICKNSFDPFYPFELFYCTCAALGSGDCLCFSIGVEIIKGNSVKPDQSHNSLPIWRKAYLSNRGDAHSYFLRISALYVVFLGSFVSLFDHEIMLKLL